MSVPTFANKAHVRATTTLLSALPENILLNVELSGRIAAEKANMTPEELEADRKALLALAADIEAHGQQSPALCRMTEQGQPELVFGYRRHAAITLINERAKKSGGKPTKLEFAYEKLTDETALVAAIRENLFRKQTRPMDDANNINLLNKRFKWGLEDIAELYKPELKKGEALDWVKERQKLATHLVEEAQAAVASGDLKVTTAKHLADVTPETQKKLLANAGTIKGKKRVTVTEVMAVKGKGKVAENAKAALTRKQEKKEAKATGKKPVAPAPVKVPAIKPTGTIYESAENMARAIEAWTEDATEAGEKAIIAALKQYRALVPFRKAEGSAA